MNLWLSERETTAGVGTESTERIPSLAFATGGVCKGAFQGPSTTVDRGPARLE